MTWEQTLRSRIGPPEAGIWRVSIKLRPHPNGCFHCRGCCPHASRLIDKARDRYRDHDAFEFVEHETGPELIVRIALATAILGASAATLGVAKSVIELITAIIKARSDGQKHGDKKDDPIELIVRGFDQNGTMFEERVLRIRPGEELSREDVERALVEVLGRHAPSVRTARAKKFTASTRAASERKTRAGRRGKDEQGGAVSPFSDTEIRK